MDMIAKLRERKAQLEQERDQFITQANGQIAYINGQIGEVDLMIAALGADSGTDETEEVTAVLNGRKLATRKREAV